MIPEEELTKEQQRMLMKDIGTSFIVVIIILAILTLIADKVFHVF